MLLCKICQVLCLLPGISMATNNNLSNEHVDHIAYNTALNEQTDVVKQQTSTVIKETNSAQPATKQKAAKSINKLIAEKKAVEKYAQQEHAAVVKARQLQLKAEQKAREAIAAQHVAEEKAQRKQAELIETKQKHPVIYSVKPEVGVDFGYTNTKFQKDGCQDKLFNRSQIPMSMFLGVNFTDYLGMEFGYTGTRKRSKEKRLDDVGEYPPGGAPIRPPDLDPAADGGPIHQLYDTKVSINQPYAVLKLQHRLYNKLSFYFAVGFSYTTTHIAWENTFENDANGVSATDRITRTQSIYMSKIIPIVKAGIYIPINNAFSIRLVSSWNQTNKLSKFIRATVDPEDAGNPLTLKPQNTLIYSIGLVYTI